MLYFTFCLDEMRYIFTVYNAETNIDAICIWNTDGKTLLWRWCCITYRLFMFSFAKDLKSDSKWEANTVEGKPLSGHSNNQVRKFYGIILRRH